MNNKGQTLVVFIIFIPVIILLMAFIVDTSLMYIAKSKLNDLSKTILKEIYDIEDKNNKVEELLNVNEINYNNYDIEINDNKVKLTIEEEIDSVFGSMIGNESYTIKSEVTGYKENDKFKFIVE